MGPNLLSSRNCRNVCRFHPPPPPLRRYSGKKVLVAITTSSDLMMSWKVTMILLDLLVLDHRAYNSSGGLENPAVVDSGSGH